MKKGILFVFLLFFSVACESPRGKCIEDLVDNNGYSYKDACEACDEMIEESARE